MQKLAITHMYAPLRVVLSSLLLLCAICGYLNCMYLALLIFQHLRLNPIHLGKTLLYFQTEQNKSLKKRALPSLPKP